jgi:hypothetical protein
MESITKTAQQEAIARFTSSPFDKHSIMMYDLPASLLRGGTSSPCYVNDNDWPDDKDRAFVAQVYAPLPNDLAAEAHSINALVPNLSSFRGLQEALRSKAATLLAPLTPAVP